MPVRRAEDDALAVALAEQEEREGVMEMQRRVGGEVPMIEDVPATAEDETDDEWIRVKRRTTAPPTEPEMYEDLPHHQVYEPMDDEAIFGAANVLESILDDEECKRALKNPNAPGDIRERLFHSLYKPYATFASAFGVKFSHLDAPLSDWFLHAYEHPLVMLHFQTSTIGLQHLKELVSFDLGVTWRAKSRCWNLVRKYTDENMFDIYMGVWNRCVWQAHAMADAKTAKQRKRRPLVTREMRAHEKFNLFDRVQNVLINLLRPRVIVTFGRRGSDRFVLGRRACLIESFILEDRVFTGAAHPSYLIDYGFTKSLTVATAAHFAVAGQAFGFILNDEEKGMAMGRKLMDAMSKKFGVHIDGEFRPYEPAERERYDAAAREAYLNRADPYSSLGWSNREMINAFDHYRRALVHPKSSCGWTFADVKNAYDYLQRAQTDPCSSCAWTKREIRLAREAMRMMQQDPRSSCGWTHAEIKNVRDAQRRASIDPASSCLWTFGEITTAVDGMRMDKLNQESSCAWSNRDIRNAVDALQRASVDPKSSCGWTVGEISAAQKVVARAGVDPKSSCGWTFNEIYTANTMFNNFQKDPKSSLGWTKAEVVAAFNRGQKATINPKSSCAWTAGEIQSALSRLQRNGILYGSCGWTKKEIMNALARWQLASIDPKSSCGWTRGEVSAGKKATKRVRCDPKSSTSWTGRQIESALARFKNNRPDPTSACGWTRSEVTKAVKFHRNALVAERRRQPRAPARGGRGRGGGRRGRGRGRQ